ncbi:class I lanthipeptide [Taibaiella koreensis]|uniref:class I lanthipeptide n=1 Tax=Taibaiella koreensis TaxID=1268548 RepID=UPI000E599E65|nr:class I lanthipeptide [Taibaiella koreensis]
MKRRHLPLTKKLLLSKQQISPLEDNAQLGLAGGAGPTADPSACITAPYTTPICCNASVVAKNTHCCPFTYPECYPG